MAFHVGIYPSFGNVATYDTVTESVKYTNVIEVYQNETDKVKHMFKEITSKNSSKFESVCICLEADYGNEIRKKFIDTAKIFGFKNVEIIDWRTAVYLNAISQSNYKLKNYDIIWIFTGYSYHVWQYKNQKVKHIFSPKECQTKIDDFGIIKTKSKLNKDPNLLLFKEEIEFDKTEFVQSFPKSECFIFKQESYAEGALVKARIMAKNGNMQNYDANPIFDQLISVNLEKTQTIYLENYESLPFAKTVPIKRQLNENNLTVKNLIINEVDNILIDFIAEFFSVIICFDINGVYSIKLLPLDSNTLKSNHGRIPEKEILCIGVDFINGEIMIQDYFSQETSKKLLNKTSKVVNNIDQAFKELIKATSFLSQNYIVFHIDDECYNHVLMAYYAACHKYDLKRFGFISTQAAELLCIFKKHQIDDWISIIAVISDKIAKRKIYCQIWKRYGNTFRADKSYLRLSDPGADDENLQKLEKESDGLIGVDLTFIDSIIDERVFNKYFNLKYKTAKIETSFAEAALIKAQILTKTNSLKILDVENNLNRRISVIINNVSKGNFVMGRQLPFKEKITFKKENCETFKIFERNAAGTKYETEFHAPAIGNWNLILHCNLSGIFYFGFEILEHSSTRHLPPAERIKEEMFSRMEIIRKTKSKEFQKMYSIPRKTILDNTKINAVGIDLGTSRCCAAVNRKNGIQTVALDYTGERLLPSYVAYDEKSVKCGKTVVNRLRNHSKSTVFDSKRIIGRSINEIEIDENWDFSISEKEGRVFIEVETFNGKNVKSPEEVAADLLKHIKQRSAEFQGINLTKAVITVPAAFTDIQKSATLEAAKFAGWDEVILLPEPIAAAFAYYIGRPIKDNSYVFLFDLGGGTLDICIFKIANNQINIISNTGDSKLGGRDFDTVLINYFKNMLNANYGISAFIYRKYKLMLECQQIKEDLTYVYSTSLNVDEFESYQDGIISITREEFERMTIFLLNKIRNTILAALFKSNLKEKQIDKVLYVGGGSRMPMIRKLLKEVFPHAEQCCEEHPDEVVAIGAAYYAYSIFSE